MRKFNAFTLAEILITLAIIGVVAALTMPTLMADVNKQQTAAALSKAINTLETNAGTLLANENVKSLFDMCGSNFIPGCLEKNTVLKVTTDGWYTTKDGLAFRQGWTGSTSAAPKLFSGSYYAVYIDVNGTKVPNSAGKDQFMVYVDGKGTVIPYGGAEYSLYTKGYYEYSVRWREACHDRTVWDAYSCTGHIVDNNFAIKYEY